MRSFRPGVHSPRAARSRTRWRLTTANSPASVRREYSIDVVGSVLSVLPMMLAVLAVGMGATLRLLRRPCSRTSARSRSQA